MSRTTKAICYLGIAVLTQDAILKGIGSQSTVLGQWHLIWLLWLPALTVAAYQVWKAPR